MPMKIQNWHSAMGGTNGQEHTNGPLVMIVDDQPTDIKLLEVFLGAQHYRTVSTLDGRSALDMATATRPDIILLDIMMPLVDGFEVCRQLKADPQLRCIPIIFLSAKDRVQDKVEGLDLGAHDYLTKPYRLEELHARLRRVLQREQDHAAVVQELENFKTNLLAVFQHELRTPLTVIGSFTDMLSRRLQDMPADQQLEYLRHIADGYESLTLFANNLLALDMLERGDPPARHPVDVAAITRGHRDSLSHLFAQKNQSVEDVWPADPGPLLVLGDATLLQQATGALLANANRYTPEGGHIRVALTLANGQACFSVLDSGPGIPAEHLDAIFNRFRRSAAIDPNQPGGLGLGLMVAHRAAQYHGGELQVSSRVGQGSEFTLKLPLFLDSGPGA